MKNKIKYFILFICILIGNCVLGQTYSLEFIYDENGNRSQRLVTEISLKVSDTTSQDSSALSNSEGILTENIDDFSVSVFPNPTQGKIDFVYTGNNFPENSKMEVINESGTIILNKFFSGESQSIDLSSFSDGIYYLKLTVNTSDKIFKIIKTH